MPRYSPRTGLLQTYQVGPFIAPHLYLQWGGSLPGDESWSCGLRLAKTGGATESEAAAAALANLAGYAYVIKQMHTRAGSCINAEAKLNTVKLNGIKANGEYVVSNTNQTIFANMAGAVGNQPPNQIALAVTLRTLFARGPASKGRFYLPMPGLLPAADGRITDADATTVDTSMTAMLTALNAVAAGWSVAVFSRKAGAPAVNNVDNIKVGRVLDTQRRRRNKLLEGYSA